MTTIIHATPSAHSVKVLEIRIEPFQDEKYTYYTIYVDDERLASVFGEHGLLPPLVLPDGKVRMVG